MRRRDNKVFMYLILGMVILSISVGYAILSANLAINGTTKIANASWNVHFENYQQTSNSTVTPASGKAPVISGTTTTEISYEVDFTTPGDVYEFTVDVKNGGTINAMIESVQTKIKIGNGEEVALTDVNLPSYLRHSFIYSDGATITSPQKLEANHKETLLVRVEYKKDITNDELAEASEKTIKFIEQINYVQADGTETEVAHSISFSNDDWSTIIHAVQTGNTSNYHVGDTKTVTLGNGLGTHTLRIANMSTPSECSTTGFSQTACGFVLEFADIITDHRMGLYTNGNVNLNGSTVNGTGNKGGWEYSDLRAFLNSTIYANENIDYSTTGIYSSLPEVLRNAIINTTVVSGHGSADTTNYTTTDKLYLLSTHEVWEDADGNANDGINYYDHAYNNTRQLDYYVGLNVTTSNYSSAVKQKNGSNDIWWLRSPFPLTSSLFFYVDSDGNWLGFSAGNICGVSPAFRIG